MNEIPLPSSFLNTLTDQLGAAEAQPLAQALTDAPVPVSIRFNPYKTAERPEGEAVGWSDYGFYLPERPLFTADPLFHGGAYYVQEASSMFLEQVFRQLFPEGEPVKILDLCAAPGGKATHLAALAGLESLVVANETIRTRARILTENVQKWGTGNIVVTHNDPQDFSFVRSFFDLVLVDAPCSGEGMFRKNPEARKEWTPENVALCAARQRRILRDVWDSLKPGGILIYSTCTFNRQENEENIAWLVSEYGCEPVHVATEESWGIARGETAGIETFRFYPHRVKGEGLFMAALRKGGHPKRDRSLYRRSTWKDVKKPIYAEVAPWFGQPDYMCFTRIKNSSRIVGYYDLAMEYVNLLAENLRILYSGIEAGESFGNRLKPAHTLGVFHDVSRTAVPETELTLPKALCYLRREMLPPALFQPGINLVSYEGLPLGWIKQIGNRRCNNLYPTDWRILDV